MEYGFNWLDYTVLIGYLFVITVVASSFSKEQHNLNDFFMASRKMPYLVVGCSILATVLSAVSITGIPAEYWNDGILYIWVLPSILISTPIVIVVFVRLYSRLNLVTAYEYLERRFSLSVRLMASGLFMLTRGTYMGIVIYASASVLHPAFGSEVSMVVLILIIGFFSIAFAALGGMKSVIWTDFIQLIVVYGGIIWMLYAMISRIDGGIIGTWEVAVESKKDFSYLGKDWFWKFDFFEKTSFWMMVLGGFVQSLANQGVDQMTVQRYLTTSSFKSSAKSILVFAIGMIPVILMLWCIGIAMYAFYQLHPEKLDTSINPNSLLPFYIVSQMPHGISGLLIAAIMAAVLTTVDSGLNCLATATMIDFQIRLAARKMTDTKYVLWARIWTVIWGVVTTLLAFYILNSAHEKSILRITGRFLGLFSGPLLGIFLLGILSKRSNTQGVVIGAILGFLTACWANFFWTQTAPDGEILHIAYHWPVVIGAVTSILAGYLLSLCFKAPVTEDILGFTLKTISHNS